MTTRYYRADSASYHTSLLKYLVGQRVGFSISADMSKSLRACCLAVPDKNWLPFEKRASEQLDLVKIEYAPGDWSKDAEPLRYVALRITPLQEELFEPVGAEVLGGGQQPDRAWGPAELVQWGTGQKAGTPSSTSIAS